jgi:hypothetical protein
MRQNSELLKRLTFYGGPVAVLASVILVAGFVFFPNETYPSYLNGFLFWLGITLGCLPLLMMHHLTGGRWGSPLRPFFKAGIATLPLMVLLVLPLFFGLRYLYPWAGLPTFEGTAVLRHRAIYLNVPGLALRTTVSVAVWLAMAWSLVWRPIPREEPSSRLRAGLQLTCGLGLVFFTIVTSFTLIDLLMAIEPAWYSSVFPAIVLNGQVLCALALALLLSLLKEPAQRADDQTLNHTSSLLFAFVLMWAYLSVSQLIIIYAGDLPNEISWYLHRTRGGWLWLASFLVIFQFVLPFALLLFRGIKKSPKILKAIAVMQLVVQAAAMFWYTEPAYRPELRISWTDPIAFLGIGIAWIVVFVWQTRRESHLNASVIS